MNIKDLSSSKELDSKAMTDVRGGGLTISNTNVAQASQDVINAGLGAAVGQQSTNATSVIEAYNFEDHSTKVDYGYPRYWF